MSRDFILVFSGGVVSLMTTLVVLFVMDYLYRRDQKVRVDRPSTAAASRDAANRNVAVLGAKADDSTQKAVVAQATKMPEIDKSEPQPGAPQVAAAKEKDSVAQKPSVDQTSPPIASVSKPIVDSSSKPKTDDSPMVKPALETKPVPKTDESPMIKPALETKPESKTEVNLVQIPAVEQKAEAATVDETPKPKVNDHPAKKPPIETKHEPKRTETAAPHPILDHESQTAQVSDGKPKPPHVVPPETIKKKALEASAARPVSKEQGG